MNLARIPLVEVADLPPSVERLVPFVGEVPVSMRAYAWRPKVLNGLLDLELALLPEGTVDVLVKARVGYVVSRINGCAYCASHVGGRLRNNGVSEEELACIIADLAETGDRAADSAVRYARLAATGQVTDADIDTLAEHYGSGEIVEITCVVGLFSFLNRVHSALGLAIEDRFARIGAHTIAPATRVLAAEGGP